MFEITPVEILGLVGGFLGAFSSLPQTFKIIRTKKADSVSAMTYIMLVLCYSIWAIYGFIQSSISLLFWNIVALLISSTVLYLKLVVWKEE